MNVPQVDIEGAELELLRGACQETLLKVRQIVMEVHDIDGRVNQVHQLLESTGFRIVARDAGVCHTVLVFAQKRDSLPLERVRSPAKTSFLMP